MNRNSFRSIMAVAAAGPLFFASVARAESRAVVVTQPQPVETVPVRPATAEVRTEAGGPNTSLIGSGILVFGVSYGAAAIVAGTSDHPGDNHLYIPVAGPWMDLASRGDCGGDRARSCDGETENKMLLVVDGVFQGLGVISILGGLLSHESREVTTTAQRKPQPNVTLHVSPSRVGYGGYGLAAFGTF